MPTYSFYCKACDHEIEETHPLAKYEKVRKPRKCPKCGKKQLVMGISQGVLFISDRVKERRKMKKRFSKRNKRLEAMPAPQQESMKRFMRKMRVKKDYNG